MVSQRSVIDSPRHSCFAQAGLHELDSRGLFPAYFASRVLECEYGVIGCPVWSYSQGSRSSEIHFTAIWAMSTHGYLKQADNVYLYRNTNAIIGAEEVPVHMRDILRIGACTFPAMTNMWPGGKLTPEANWFRSFVIPLAS